MCLLKVKSYNTIINLLGFYPLNAKAKCCAKYPKYIYIIKLPRVGMRKEPIKNWLSLQEEGVTWDKVIPIAKL